MKPIALALVLGTAGATPAAVACRGRRSSGHGTRRSRCSTPAPTGQSARRVAVVMPIASFVLLVTFIVANLRITGFALLPTV